MTISSKYTKPAMFLHWAIALLIAVNIALALSTELFPDESIRAAIDTHKSIGITVLGLVLLRIVWRIAHPPPALPASFAPWERRLASAGHVGLYVLMLCIPLTGWMHDSAWKDAATHPMQLFYTISWPRIGLIEQIQPEFKEYLHSLLGLVHQSLNGVLLLLFIAHIGAVVKHHVKDKEPVLQRMLP
jgi:cytochrome b561